MRPPAEAAVRAGDDPLLPHDVDVPSDPLGHVLRVLDHVRRVADDARDEHLVVGQGRPASSGCVMSDFIRTGQRGASALWRSTASASMVSFTLFATDGEPGILKSFMSIVVSPWKPRRGLPSRSRDSPPN